MTVYLVCGGRRWVDPKFVFKTLSELDVTAIVHGGAQGVDTVAGEWAKLNGVPVIMVPANWKFYGKPAGVLRNGWMLSFTKLDEVLAFPGGPGTASTVAQARVLQIPVTLVDAW